MGDFRRVYEIKLYLHLHNNHCPRGSLMIAFMCLKETSNWTSSTHQLINSVELPSVPGKTLFSSCLHPFHILNHLLTSEETGSEIISFIPVTLYKGFLSSPWLTGSQISYSLCVSRRGTSVDGAAALLSFLILAWWNSLVDCSYSHCLLRIHLPGPWLHTAKQMETHKSNTLQATWLQMYPCAIKNGSLSFCWL